MKMYLLSDSQGVNPKTTETLIIGDGNQGSRAEREVAVWLHLQPVSSLCPAQVFWTWASTAGLHHSRWETCLWIPQKGAAPRKLQPDTMGSDICMHASECLQAKEMTGHQKLL